jgi:hypothetical protein
MFSLEDALALRAMISPAKFLYWALQLQPKI